MKNTIRVVIKRKTFLYHNLEINYVRNMWVYLKKVQLKNKIKVFQRFCEKTLGTYLFKVFILYGHPVDITM